MSSKKYTVAVSDVVEVPVKFTLKEGRVNKPFAFTLTVNRIESEEFASRMEAVGFRFKEGLLDMKIITDWKDQRVILDEEGKPAEFCPEALEAMLSVPVVAQIVYQAIQKECGAKEKN